MSLKRRTAVESGARQTVGERIAASRARVVALDPPTLLAQRGPSFSPGRSVGRTAELRPWWRNGGTANAYQDHRLRHLERRRVGQGAGGARRLVGRAGG